MKKKEIALKNSEMRMADYILPLTIRQKKSINRIAGSRLQSFNKGLVISSSLYWLRRYQSCFHRCHI